MIKISFKWETEKHQCEMDNWKQIIAKRTKWLTEKDQSKMDSILGYQIPKT